MLDEWVGHAEMTLKTMAVALCVGSLTNVVLGSLCIAATSIRPAMQAVVTCVYDAVRSTPGLLSVDVYAVGTEKYVIQYTFRDKGTTLTGGIGIHDRIMSDGKYFSTNDTPSGQPDDHGLVELDFLGKTRDDMYEKCRLAPGFDNTMRSPGTPDPEWQKVDVSGKSN